MNKKIIGVTLALLITGSSFAMEMVATDTMMKKDDMVQKFNMASETMMKKDMKDMKEMMKDETKMMMKDNMKKCLDVKKATKAEVKAFQKANGIVQTGFIGKLTKAKLAKMDCMKDMMDKSTTSVMMKDKMSTTSMNKASSSMTGY